MRPGSVIVDMAAEAGGNCELTEPGEIVVTRRRDHHGPLNLPSQMPYHASQMYANNVAEPASAAGRPEGELNLDFEDEIIAGCLHHPRRQDRERARTGGRRSAASA